MPQLRKRAGLRPQTPAPRRWVWDGFVGPGLITLFSSRWKIGKTTLLGMLLARMGEGGSLAGGAVAQGTAVVVSEEPADVWDERAEALGIGDHVDWILRPFRGLPSADEWFAFVAGLAELPHDLIVLDPLGMMLPAHTENQAATVFEALEPLHRLTEAGRAVLALHHPRKGNAKEFSHRGSGALTGLADVLMELTTAFGAAATDRRRTLRAVSRLHEPLARVIERTADGRSYDVRPEPPAPDDFPAAWEVVRMVLETADRRLSRKGVLKGWPDDFEAPPPTSLRRWLERAVAEGKANRTGTGHKARPFLYALPGKAFQPYGAVRELQPFHEVLQAVYGNAPTGGVLDERELRRGDEPPARRGRRGKGAAALPAGVVQAATGEAG